MIKAIVTMPPYAPYMKEAAMHPIVSGVRLNTVMPTRGSLEDVLKSMQDKMRGKDIWIDLKGRQLRVESYWAPPFTEIRLSHPIEVHTPVSAYFSDGQEEAQVIEVDGNRLIMGDGPRRIIGPGESVNIIDPSLKIHGYLTKSDLGYMEAAEKVGIKRYMLSFVEKTTDIEAVKSQIPDASIVAKIESQRGLYYVANTWNKETARLMAARGDLYVEIERPHLINRAVEQIVKKDPEAIVGSRIFSSLAFQPEPSCADIGDAENLIRMGYKTFMFGDEMCLQRSSLIGGLNLLMAMIEHYAN